MRGNWTPAPMMNLVKTTPDLDVGIDGLPLTMPIRIDLLNLLIQVATGHK